MTGYTSNACRGTLRAEMDAAERNLQAGHEALRRGDARAAREHLQRALEAGRADAPVLLGLATAALALNDDEIKVAALDRLLALEPRNLRALILKADHLAKSGDLRAAVSYYQQALRTAAARSDVPAELAPDLRRAQQMAERYAAEYQQHLLRELTARGFDPATASRRFTQSVDLILGRKRIYVQEPRYYYFPELPQIQFYDREQFPWLTTLEQATSDIRAELLEV
ncbi:MAG: hypothetical protein NZM12_07550, partial [Steroidobacteraceae bacterium]|nr:hypothetical protein [Steroidobacteraceae bacterium]